MKKLKKIIELCLFLLIVCSCCTPKTVKSPPKRVAATSVTIYNSADQNMSILIGETASQTETYIIKRGENWISPIYNANPTIKIKTLKRTIKYQLEIGKSYKIIWNSKGKYWDINELVGDK
jgi:hypothetical protein